MKVLEIKNNLVKISYTGEDKLLLSGFVIIEDSKSPYVAQVLSLKADNGINYAIVKLLFTFDSEGIVKNYDGTIPSLDSDVTKLTSDELLDILPVSNPLEIGTLAHQDVELKVDRSMLEQNLLICSEDAENTNTLTENFVVQLADDNRKSVIFDIDGNYQGKTLKFGEDFKLPLNYNTINFIYEHDLDNVEPASKALIQDIFLEVQEYSKTVLDKFIPFDTFISVVDQQYKATGLTELVLLKNKLLKYKEENVFAQNAKEIHNLRSAIRANLTNILDISSASDILQNEIMKYVYDSIDEMDLFVYSFVRLNNDNADKKLIRHFLTKDKIYTTIACSHNFKYLYELKERANNMILFVPQTMQHDFASYNTFLNKLNSDEFIIYGKATQNVPLIIELSSIFEDSEEEEPETEETVEETETTTEETEEEEIEKPDDFSDESNSYSYDTLVSDDAPAEPEQAEEQETIQNEAPQPEEEDVDEEEPVQPDVISNIIDEEIAEESETEQTPEIIEDDKVEEIEEPETVVIPEAQTEVLPPDEEEQTIEEPVISESYITESQEIVEEPQAIEDNAAEVVDEIMFSQPQPAIPSIEQELEEEEALTEDDLNFIEDVNIGATEISPDIEVPIYPAETPSREDLPEFEQGDRVTHPKYGEGVVEKMIKYGNKTLCSINFVNIGRRLLDPAISELEKV